MSFLEDLFFGKINPFSRTTATGGKSEELNRKIAEQYDALHCTLNQEQKEMLVRLMELNGESDTTERLDSFIVGFRMGASCIYDAFLSDNVTHDVNLTGRRRSGCLHSYLYMYSSCLPAFSGREPAPCDFCFRNTWQPQVL